MVASPSLRLVATANAAVPLLLLLLLLLSPFGITNSGFFLAPVHAQEQSAEYYCGTSWPHAAAYCTKHCPSGDDSECDGLVDDAGGTDFACYYYTGCSSRVDINVTDDDDDDLGFTALTSNNFCGLSWVHAMMGCSAPCPGGWECDDEDERCFAATNCDKPLQELVSELLTTLQGPDTTMDGTDQGIFGLTIQEFLREVAEDEGISLNGIDLGEQNLVTTRELQRRADHRALLGHERYLNFDITNITQRMLPSGSSAIDVSMVVTGDYRPPPYLDLDVIAEDSINRNGAKVVKTLRDRGERAGREFFSRVQAIEAVKKVDVTARPTMAPVKSPTWSPIGPPTGTPSGMPSSSPSSAPSSLPSRSIDQVIMTGSRKDLQMGGETTSSYGYIFNIRTKPMAGVILLNNFDFYTGSTDMVRFEMWTRLGSYQEHKGTYEGWDLIAEGETEGRGIGRYTSIPDDMFTKVSIPGGGGEGGTRAFYLTLTSIDLVYKVGAKGTTPDTLVHASTEDIDIYEGESVLFYPFPDPKDKFFYRGPRQYLGAVYYNRLPCAPFSVFGPVDELPCPAVPTGNPTVPPPTYNPVVPPTASPSGSPVFPPTEMPTPTTPEPTPAPYVGSTPQPINPTAFPTQSPTESLAPTDAPTTAEPTSSPVVPMRCYVVTTLRNVPRRAMTDREGEKLVEILTAFLRRHTDGTMVLDGVEIWHAGLIVVDAKEGTVAAAVAEDEEEEGGGGSEIEEGAVARGIMNRDLAWKKRVVEPPPPVDAVDITLILKISFANLPFELLGNMASVAIEEHEEELLNLLHEQQAFYTFFRNTDGVSSRTIEDITFAPSAGPTSLEHFLERQAALEAEDDVEILVEDSAKSTFGIMVGLAIGLLWCCLTAISITYLMSVRGEMEEQRDMENLLKAEQAADPLAGVGDKDDTAKDDAGNAVVKDPAADLKASRKLGRQTTVPLGDDELDDDDPFDHSKNMRLAPHARSELAKSTAGSDDSGLTDDFGDDAPRRRQAYRGIGARVRSTMSRDGNNLGADDGAPGRRGAGVRMQSTIVTSKERYAMLDSDAKRRAGAGAVGGDDGRGRRRSAGPKFMSKDAQRRSLTTDAGNDVEPSSKLPSRATGKKTSQSMVLPQTNADSLDRELDVIEGRQQSLKSSQRRGDGRRNSRAKSMIASDGHRGSGTSMRPSTRKHRSSDNLASMRRSAAKHGSHDDVAGLKRSARKGERR